MSNTTSSSSVAIFILFAEEESSLKSPLDNNDLLALFFKTGDVLLVELSLIESVFLLGGFL